MTQNAKIIVLPVVPRPIPRDAVQVAGLPDASNISERQSRRMNLWLIDSEKYLGLKATRAMLVIALQWIDGRRMFKKG